MLKKLFSRSRKRTLAQAMVEFALALPVLLMVIYGTLEAGRLLFIYASVVSAARNAVRYASADGLSPSGEPYYQDCDGITATANNLAFIAPLSQIYITYDAGLSYQYGNQQPISGPPAIPLGPTDPYAQCSSIGTWPTFQSGYRVNVQVQAQYSPIIAIGNLIPSFKPLTIISQSSRTLLLSIPINVTPNGTFIAAASTLTAYASTLTASAWTPTNVFTATNGPTPTNTPITSSPTNTPITPTSTQTPNPPTVTGTPPTATRTPTPIPGTPVYTLTPPIANCSGSLSNTGLTISGTTMSMNVTNSTGQVLAVQAIYLYWNNTTGHSGGPVKLLSMSVGGTSVWSTSPGIYTSFYSVPFTSASVPTGTSTIAATFDQTYNTSLSGSEIYVMFWTNGCQYTPIYAIQP